MARVTSEHITTPPVVLAFAKVIEPEENDFGKMVWRTVLLFDKSNEADMACVKKLQGLISETKKKAFAHLEGRKLEAVKKSSPLKDGDDDACTIDDAVGHYYLNVSTQRKPKFYNEDAERTSDIDGFTSGAKCAVQINIYSYETDSNRGVTGGLSALQLIEAGDGAASAPEPGFKPVSTNDEAGGNDPGADDEEW